MVRYVRLKEKAENQFGIIKNYYSNIEGGMNDIDIFENGIEIFFAQVSDHLNAEFVRGMNELLECNAKAQNLFNYTINMLEILSIEHGTIIIDEFRNYMKVNIDCENVYKANKVSNNEVYEKILEKTMLYSSEPDESIYELLEYIYEIYDDALSLSYSQADSNNKNNKNDNEIKLIETNEI